MKSKKDIFDLGVWQSWDDYLSDTFGAVPYYKMQELLWRPIRVQIDVPIREPICEQVNE